MLQVGMRVRPSAESPAESVLAACMREQFCMRSAENDIADNSDIFCLNPLTTSPCVIFFDPPQQPGRHMIASPFTCRIFVGLWPGRISMDSRQYPLEAQALFHREREFCQQIAGMLRHNGHTQDTIF